MIKRPLIAAASLVALASVSAGAVSASDPTASGSDPDRAAGASVPASEWMPVSAVAQKLEEQGYTVYEIERDGGVYDVDLVDASGVRREAYLDPRTGDIVRWDDD